jgi:hypothetical protein
MLEILAGLNFLLTCGLIYLFLQHQKLRHKVKEIEYNHLLKRVADEIKINHKLIRHMHIDDVIERLCKRYEGR